MLARQLRLPAVPSTGGASSLLLAPRDLPPHAQTPRAALSSTIGAGTLRLPVASAPSISGGVTPLRRLKDLLLAETW